MNKTSVTFPAISFRSCVCCETRGFRYLFPWLLHLDQDGDDEQDKNDSRRDADDGAVGLGDLMEKPLRSLLCRQQVEEKTHSGRTDSARAENKL